MTQLFAEASVGVPLSAEPIVDIFGLHFTNSMLYGLIMSAVIVGLLGWAASRSRVHPMSRLAFAAEQGVDWIFDMCVQNFGTREKAAKFFPLLFTLFIFILFANLSSLIPGVGTVNVTHNGEQVPLLRAFTVDLNATLAMAILVNVTVQVAAFRELGLKAHLKHYFTDKPWNPLNFVIGLIEILSELIRNITLSMRLFGVMYAGEVLIHVIGILGGNFGWLTQLPVYLLEMFFCLIQAYVFLMLSTVYLAMATRHDGAEHAPESAESAAVVG